MNPPEGCVSANGKVLLVEDSKFLRMANERALSRAGYEVSTAPTSQASRLVLDYLMMDLIPSHCSVLLE